MKRRPDGEWARRLRAKVKLVIHPAALKRLKSAPIPTSAAPAKSPKALSIVSAKQTPQAQLSRRTGGKRVVNPRPVLDTIAKLRDWHRECDRRLKHYWHLDRAQSQRLDRATRDELDPAAAKFLPANNVEARTCYAHLLERALAGRLRSLAAAGQVFWVTLVIETYTMTVDDAVAFEPRRLQAWTRAVLGPCSFVGIVEAALYTNVGLIRERSQRAVSWHVHLLLWDLSAAAIRRVRVELNRRYRTLVPGVPAAYAVAIEPSEITAKICYMLKAPFTDYRLIACRHKHTDWHTGEVTLVGTGRFEQKKREMRPGDMTLMCRVFARRHIDQLTFAASGGRAVLKQANHAALADYRAWHRRQPWFGRS